MSMLAERKRKQKWSLNPRGKEWSQDTNKFGQKLLEKMGWQHGKGLGAREDGMTEHIKVSHKIDSKGMGYKETNDQWTEHETNFSALLSALSGDKGETSEKQLKLKSLEQKSQSSRARVHYHKFTRGKDLSRYSEKDLANIFGKKSLARTEETAKEETESKDSGTYFSGGSMRDYFKKKLPKFGKINDFVVGNNGVLKKADDSGSESETKPSFGFGFNSNEPTTNFVSYIQEQTPTKRKAEENHQEVIFSPSKKHKKDRKQRSKEDLGLTNPAFDPLTSPNRKLERHVLDPIPESPTEYLDENINGLGENEEMLENLGKISDTPSENKNKEVIVDVESEGHFKLKKMKKIQADIDSKDSVDSISVTENNDAATNQETKRKKKKQKLLSANFSYQDENVSTAVEENPYEVKLSEKKPIDIDLADTLESPVNSINVTEDNDAATNKETKRNKKKKQRLLYDNLSYQDENISIENSTVVEENPYEVKLSDISQKKKKKQAEIDFANTAESLVDSINNNKDTTYKETKRNKKKKQKLLYDNLSYQDENISFENSTAVEENPYEVKLSDKSQKKKKKQTKIDLADTSESAVNHLNVAENNDATNKETKTKKKKKQKLLYDSFSYQNENVPIEKSVATKENPYEVKLSQKKKKKLLSNIDSEDRDSRKNKTKKTEVENAGFNTSENSLAKENPNFDNTEDSLPTNSTIEDNPYEVKPKKEKRKKAAALENPAFNDSIASVSTAIANPYELHPKKSKKSKKHPDPVQPSQKDTIDDSSILDNCDLMLNTVSTPIVKPNKPPNVHSLRHRKSVRFSNVTQELIIPNNDDLNEMSEPSNLDSISKTLDNYQAEMENDINEEKVQTVRLEDLMVGEVGDPHGENEKLADCTKLKFKYAHLNAKTPFYQLDKIGPKKSYKHLIKGDILVKFKNTNLHEIQGYAVHNKTSA